MTPALVAAITLTIRLHNPSGVPAPDAREAMRVAGTVLAPAGVTVDWAICDGDHRAPPDRRCSVPPAPGELIVRLIDAASTGESLDVFGYAVVDRETRRGTLATVFPDRIRELARVGHAETGGLLGRAIAHELGHLLLGTTSHEREGLMRAYWLADEVRRRFTRDWTFSASSILDVRRAAQEVVTTAAAQVVATSSSR